MTKNGIVYLTMAEHKYPQKLAFVFLSEIAQLFLAELQNTYGTSSNVDYLSKIETIDSQYAFLKFGKHQKFRTISICSPQAQNFSAA